MTYLYILLSGLLINNFIFQRFLGICPFLGVSKRVETAAGMSMAVIFVMTISSAVTWIFQHWLLAPRGLEYLQTLVFILVIATLVQFVEMVVLKTSPVLYQALGIYLPLITTNCAVLGVALINVVENYTLIESVINGFASACGWSMAILLFSGIRERWEITDIPEALKGFPIAFISTGLMSISFYGFQGLFQTLFK
jgi:electron transport complex protein RnfA